MASKQQILAPLSKRTTPQAPHAPLSVLPKPSVQVQQQLHRPSFFSNKAKRPFNHRKREGERESRGTVSKRTCVFYDFLGSSSSQSEDQKERRCLGSSSPRFYDFLGVESHPKLHDFLGVMCYPSDCKGKWEESYKENNEVSTDLKLFLYEPVTYQAEREIQEAELLESLLN